MGDTLPGIIDKVERHKDEVIQMFLPSVLPTADDPLMKFSGPLILGRHHDRQYKFRVPYRIVLHIW